MPPKRKTLAERNAEDIAKEAAGQAPAAAPENMPAEQRRHVGEAILIQDEPEQQLDPLDVGTTASRGAANVKRQGRNALDERVNLGIYLTTETYDEMKAAYLADWANRRGDSATLYQWVADALNSHAARSVIQRASAPPTQKRATTRTGNTRAFKIPGDVYARMQDAIAADEKAERWVSESAWSVEAITHAIDAARNANGNTLPATPRRLPNRLKRRD
ncbi:MAG: hypothetical protein ACRCTR_06210 [Actinomycetota bacterium]